MSDDHDNWLTVEQAAHILGIGTRQVHRYGEQGRLQTRRGPGKRTLFAASDVEQLAIELGIAHREPPPPPPSKPQIIQQQQSELLEMIQRLQEELRQATYREAYLKGQLDQRLALPDERRLREELEVTRLERDSLRSELNAVQHELSTVAGQRQWSRILVVGLILVVIILAAFLVSGRM